MSIAVSAAVMSLVSEFAPGLVRRLAGEGAGDVVERVLGFGRRLTGRQAPEEIAVELRRNVEAAHEFRMQASALDVELERAYLADRQDARSRDLELARLGRSNRRGDVLAFAAIAGLIATIALVFFVSVPEGPARDVVLLLAGALIVIVKDVYAFEFGSSRGSKEKSELLTAGRGRPLVQPGPEATGSD